MPANLLIFDADYVSELTSRMNVACELLSEAVTSLHSAVNHDNWKCKERARIAESFDELNQKLGRLDTGVNETTRILSGSVSRFAALESQYESQADNLSDELTSNHGFSATVRTAGSSAGASGVAGAAGSVGASMSGANASESSAGKNDTPSGENRNAGSQSGSRGGSGGASVHINAGNNLLRQKKEADNSTNAGTNSVSGTGGGSMNVNLPVTHIPDNPGAAARGTRDAQEIANAALTSVAGAITEALANANSSEGFDRIAAKLADSYNAGRSIFESSSAILANPSQPHTSERLTMAAGLVTLAQGTGNFQSVSASSSVNISQNAGQISSALQDNSEASELRNLLAAFTGQDISSDGEIISTSSSGDEEMSFFDMIIEELKKMFSGGKENNSSYSSSSSLASSSPVMEFLGNFVMDQAV